jgi:hypothetical protein
MEKRRVLGMHRGSEGRQREIPPVGHLHQTDALGIAPAPLLFVTKAHGIQASEHGEFVVVLLSLVLAVLPSATELRGGRRYSARSAM